MAVTTSIRCFDAVSQNRFSAEYFDPKYVFTPNNNIEWKRIGRILKKCQYGISITMNENGSGSPIFRMNEIDNCFATRAAKYANITLKEFEAFQLQENDVLFNRTNSLEFVGRTGLVKDQSDSVFASYLVRVVPDESVILPEFLTIYLNTKFGIGQVKRRAMPSINQANVSAAELKRVLIPLFPLDVQQGIAGLVNSAYHKKEESKNLYTQSQQLLESKLGLDKLKFEKPVGYETSFSEVMQGRRVDAQCYNPEFVHYGSFLRENANFEYMRDLVGGMIKGKQMETLSVGSIPYVSIKDIQGVDLIADAFCSLEKETRVAIRNDLLLAITGATIGKIGIVERYDRLAFSGDLLALKASSKIAPYYLLAVMQGPIGQSQCQRWISGSTNGHLAPHDVGKLVIPRLSEAKERKIAGLVESSLEAKRESEHLLQQAKTRVEQLIEEAVAQ